MVRRVHAALKAGGEKARASASPTDARAGLVRRSRRPPGTTTTAGQGSHNPHLILVRRELRSPARPEQPALGVDITFVPTQACFLYLAVVLDAWIQGRRCRWPIICAPSWCWMRWKNAIGHRQPERLIHPATRPPVYSLAFATAGSPVCGRRMGSGRRRLRQCDGARAVFATREMRVAGTSAALRRRPSEDRLLHQPIEGWYKQPVTNCILPSANRSPMAYELANGVPPTEA